MATTTFLYRAQRIRDYLHAAMVYKGGAIYHHITRKVSLLRCRCGARRKHLTLAGRFERTFRALPVGSMPYFIVLRGHFVSCDVCGGRGREHIHFADGQRRYTRAFGRYVQELCELMPISSVAKKLGVGWDMVKELHSEALERKYPTKDFSEVRYIGIDEFAIRKGHDYMTVVVDIETGVILHAVEGKDAASVIPFLTSLREAAAPLQAVAIDMSSAFMNAVRAAFGDTVDIVHDRYHVVALANKALDETRRDVQREVGKSGRKAIKGARFVLLTAAERLSESQQDTLKRLQAVNQPIFTAHLLKEQLRLLWVLPYWLAEFTDISQRAIAGGWCQLARASGLASFEKLASTLTERREGILAYFHHRITNGKVEGLNNKIKVLKRQAYGFRDMVYFKLRLYALHHSRLMLS